MSKPTLNENWIDPTARKIVHTLKSAGFETYLVGGCVRDLLAGIHPKDFDIATNAHPNEVKRKVPGSYVIGKRFRLVLVKRGNAQFEVATFRRSASTTELEDENNTVTGDNFFGTVEEDAKRRDFTINALFYDPIDQNLIDYVDGKPDVDSCIIRMIGEPRARLIEDPIRSLRAVRLSHKLDFSIEPALRAAIVETAPELAKTALPRRREEYLKIMRLSEPLRAWLELKDLAVLKAVVPSLDRLFEDSDRVETFGRAFANAAWAGIDFQSSSELFSAFLYAVARAKEGDIDLDPERLEGDALWTQLIRDELGVFKIEATIFLIALDLLRSLRKIDSYQRKGHRRQVGFLKQESLPLALKLSQMDGWLTPAEFEFWVNEIRTKSQASPETPLPDAN